MRKNVFMTLLRAQRVPGFLRALQLFLLTLVAFGAGAQAPTFSSTPVTTATVGQPYVYSVTATAPNNQPVTLSGVNVPSWATFNTAGQSTSMKFGESVNNPGGIAGDAAGNIYVTDNYEPTVYKITPDGTTTQWFTRLPGAVYGMLVIENDLYISYYTYDDIDYYNNNPTRPRITKVNLVGTPVETPLVTTGIAASLSMVHRNGFLYVADYGDNKIKKVNLANNVVSDVVTINGVFGLGFNSVGTLYAASWSGFKVYAIDINSSNPQGTVTEKVSLPSYTSDVKVDANDNVYISGSGFVRKYTPNFSSYVNVWSGTVHQDYIWGMSLTTGGTLLFGISAKNEVHKLQTGAMLTGTPTLSDIGVHHVELKADNGTNNATQSFDISVYGPSTYTVSNLNKHVGDAAFDLTQPTSNSNGAFTYTSNNTSVASVSGNTITIGAAGTATITVTQDAADLYLQTQKTFTITVTKPAPTLSWSNIDKQLGDADFVITPPQSNSSGAFSYTSSNTGVATISGSTVTIIGVGTTTITATQAANSQYTAGSTTTTLTVSNAQPEVSSFNPASGETGTVITITGSHLSTVSAVTINGVPVNTFTLVDEQTVTAVVDQSNTTGVIAVTTQYGNAASNASFIVKVMPSLSGFGNMVKTYGDAAFTLSDPQSNSTGAFTYQSSDPAVIAINGNTATVMGAGSATITATQATDAHYLSGTIAATITVQKASPVIGSLSNLQKTYGDAAFVLNAPQSNSTGVFTYTSSDPSVVAINGNTATVVGAGSVTITATQAADANFTTGTTVMQVSVQKANPTLAGFTSINKTYGDAAFALVAPQSNSTGAFTYESSNPSVIAINGSTATIIGAGTATITASQASSANYMAGSASTQVVIHKADPVLSQFHSLEKTYGDAGFTISAPQSNSTGAFTYTSSDPSVVAIQGNRATIVGAGTATITATQATDVNYTAKSVNTQVIVHKADPVLTGFADISKTYGDASFTLVAPQSNSTGAFTYSVNTTGVAGLNNNKISIQGAGTATVTVIQAATDNYNSGSATAILTIARKELTVTVTDKIKCVGTLIPALQYSISGFVNGENATVLAQQPVAFTTALQNSAPGTYTINASGGIAANYSFKYVAGTLTVNSPANQSQRMPTVDAIKGEYTQLFARSFGTTYEWRPATGLTTTTASGPQANLQKEQEYTIYITEKTGCVVTDTVKVRVYERPDVFVPSLFSPNGDGINDELRINPVGIKTLYYFGVYNRWGKLVFHTNNINDAWNGRFQGALQPMETYNWILRGVDKNGKSITQSGSTTMLR